MAINKQEGEEFYINVFIGRDSATFGQHIRTERPSNQSADRNDGKIKPTYTMKNPFSFRTKEHIVAGVDETKMRLIPIVINGHPTNKYLRFFPQGYYGEPFFGTMPIMVEQELKQTRFENRLLKKERIKIRKMLVKATRKDEIDMKQLLDTIKELKKAVFTPIPDELRGGHGGF